MRRASGRRWGLALWLAAGVLAHAAGGQDLVPVETGPIAARVVADDDHSVDIELLNRGRRVVREVRLHVQLVFQWSDDQHPGDDSPSRTETAVVAAEIPPGDRLVHTHRLDPPLPPRSDGRFEARVHVMGWTEVPAGP